MTRITDIVMYPSDPRISRYRSISAAENGRKPNRYDSIFAIHRDTGLNVSDTHSGDVSRLSKNGSTISTAVTRKRTPPFFHSLFLSISAPPNRLPVE
jgi:hypothetical protein